MIHYVLMEDSHVSGIANLEKRSFTDPWSEKSIAAELENPLSLWLVAIDEDKVVGYVGSQSVMGEGDMMNIAVDPAYRRRGIGGQLVENLVASLLKKGVHSLSLEVRVSNEAAISLYQKLGFREIGCRKNYYRHPREDGLILRKEWEI